jgi:hypothetical protein
VAGAMKLRDRSRGLSRSQRKVTQQWLQCPNFKTLVPELGQHRKPLPLGDIVVRPGLKDLLRTAA